MSKIPRDREIELAWAAGFMDGEGHFGVKKEVGRKHALFMFRTGQIDRQVLDRLRAAVDAGKVYGPYPRKGLNQKPFHNFNIFGDEAVKAYQQIYPYLSLVKRAQGDAALEEVKRTKQIPRQHKGIISERIYPWPLLASPTSI